MQYNERSGRQQPESSPCPFTIEHHCNEKIDGREVGKKEEQSGSCTVESGGTGVITGRKRLMSAACTAS